MAKITITSRPLKPGEFKASPFPRDYEAIGEFITACGLLEVTLHLVIRPLLEIDDSIARRLVGEPRINDLIDLLKFALNIQRPLPLSPRAHELMGQLMQRVDYINSVRAIVAHKPCNTDGASIEFHNRLTSKTASSQYEYVCTAVQLKACADHALNVAHAIRDVLHYSERTAAYWERSTRELLASIDRLDLPTRPASKHPQTAPKPKPQPRSSRKKSGKE